MLKHCAANRKGRISALPDVGPYIYDVKISGFTRNSIYIYDISRLRVNSVASHVRGKYILSHNANQVHDIFSLEQGINIYIHH
jgi:hypothetical protein